MNIFLDSLGVFLVVSQIFRLLIELVNVANSLKNCIKMTISSYSYAVLTTIGVILIKNF